MSVSTRSNERGFTLTEILIVMVILGILGAVVVFAVQDMTKSTASSSCQSDYKTVETAQETYRLEVGTPAASFGDLTGTTTGVDGTQVGPWIKDVPISTNGYSIGFDALGNITVSSANPFHAATDGNGNCAYA